MSAEYANINLSEYDIKRVKNCIAHIDYTLSDLTASKHTKNNLLLSYILSAQKFAIANAKTGNYQINKKLYIDKNVSVYLISDNEDNNMPDNWRNLCTSIRIIDNKTKKITLSSVIVYVIPTTINNNRSIYFTASGSVYEAPSDLSYLFIRN